MIADHIREKGQDYRWETAPNPIPTLQNRKQDNVEVGRVPDSVLAGVSR